MCVRAHACARGDVRGVNLIALHQFKYTFWRKYVSQKKIKWSNNLSNMFHVPVQFAVNVFGLN